MHYHSQSPSRSCLLQGVVVAQIKQKCNASSESASCDRSGEELVEFAFTYRMQVRSSGEGYGTRDEAEEDPARGLSKHCGLSFDISLGKPTQPSLSEPHCTTLQHFGRSRWDAEREEPDVEDCSRK